MTTSDPAAATTITTYTVNVSFTVHPHADAHIQDQYAICDEVGQWLQTLIAGFQRERLDMEAGSVSVRPETLPDALNDHAVMTTDSPGSSPDSPEAE